MAKRDYYDVLGVSRTASEDEIKRAYRSLAKQMHPDANQSDKGAEEKFKEVNEAYQVLSAPRKRKAYDTFGHEGSQMGGSSAGGFEGGVSGFPGGFGDVFEDLFDGFFQGRRSGRRSRAPGEDLSFEVNLTLEEAFTGGMRKVAFERTEICGTCSGSGAKPGTEPKVCGVCGGRGQVHISQGFFAISRTCHRCRGRGMVIDQPCPICRGGGRVKIERNLVVNVPAGVDTGMRVRLEGEGEPGENGGPRGDLYLIVNVKEHEIFERNGSDLLLRLPVPVTLAASGGETSVPTLNGNVKLKIQSGAQSGQILRLRGRGLPGVHQRSRGDMLVTIFVEVPQRLSARQKELLREIEKESSPGDYEEVGKFSERVKRYSK